CGDQEAWSKSYRHRFFQKNGCDREKHVSGSHFSRKRCTTVAIYRSELRSCPGEFWVAPSVAARKSMRGSVSRPATGRQTWLHNLGRAARKSRRQNCKRRHRNAWRSKCRSAGGSL